MGEKKNFKRTLYYVKGMKRVEKQVEDLFLRRQGFWAIERQLVKFGEGGT